MFYLHFLIRSNMCLALKPVRYYVKCTQFLRQKHRKIGRCVLTAKQDEKIEKYKECGLRFDGDKHTIAYIEENRRKMSCHGTIT